MNRSFLQAHFYESYHFAFCIRNVLHDQVTYIRHLNDFYGDGSYLSFVAPFPRYSSFHRFLDFVIGDILTESTENCDLDKRQNQIAKFQSVPSTRANLKLDVLPIEDSLQYHGIPFTRFTEWLDKTQKVFADANDEDVREYLTQLADDSVIDTLQEQSVRETFYLLFGNRHVLMLFNQMMAEQISQASLKDISPDFARHFQKNGVLRRVRIPRWVQRTVFFRDRGLCVFCGKDLSGKLAIWSEEHFDHIVPLAHGGLNDVTNIQLLCGDCNRTKSRGEPRTSVSYEDWYNSND